jgi:hypothetical protein
MRQQAMNTIAVESPRGFRIAKEKASRKIDSIVALSMACVAALDAPPPAHLPDLLMRFWDRVKTWSGTSSPRSSMSPCPRPHRRPRVSIPSVVWRQLLTDSERQQKWARSLERQRHEAREEAEARARYAEQLRQAIEQSPNRALFPAEPSLWLTGQDLLGFLANPSQWRSR